MAKDTVKKIKGKRSKPTSKSKINKKSKKISLGKPSLSCILRVVKSSKSKRSKNKTSRKKISKNMGKESRS